MEAMTLSSDTLSELRRLTEMALAKIVLPWVNPEEWGPNLGDCLCIEDQEFIHAASPVVIRSLLDDLVTERAKVERLRVELREALQT